MAGPETGRDGLSESFGIPARGGRICVIPGGQSEPTDSLRHPEPNFRLEKSLSAPSQPKDREQ